MWCNTWNKQPRTDQSDYSISLKYGIKCGIALHLSLFMLQFPLEYGAVLIPVKFVSLEAVLLTKDWWRCTVVDGGELCVMMGLIKMVLTLFVDSWDTREHLNMITSASEKYISK